MCLVISKQQSAIIPKIASYQVIINDNYLSGLHYRSVWFGADLVGNNSANRPVVNGSTHNPCPSSLIATQQGIPSYEHRLRRFVSDKGWVLLKPSTLRVRDP